MIFNPEHLRAFLTHDFSTVIDVRSPAEFAEDRIPGAINLPVLDDEERARVGTMYKQDSPFKARKIGAALVFENAARHLRERLSHHDGRWRPLVYCWRGGQRSGSFTWMLREIGWRAEVVEGGYRNYRRKVQAYLYDHPLPFRLVQLGGYTGTAKTAILAHLSALGVQIVDLEALANHRGSLLGAMPEGQPSQKAFESALAAALVGLDPKRPVVVEAESSKIGELNLPPSLWAAMKAAPWIEVNAPVAARARYLSEAYADVLADPEALADRLHPLRFHRGHALVEKWCAMARDGDVLNLCQSLAEDHYDPAYRKAASSVSPNVVRQIHTKDLSVTAQEDAANTIASYLQTMEI